jgi:hypothetical protein
MYGFYFYRHETYSQSVKLLDMSSVEFYPNQKKKVSNKSEILISLRKMWISLHWYSRKNYSQHYNVIYFQNLTQIGQEMRKVRIEVYKTLE